MTSHVFDLGMRGTAMMVIYSLNDLDVVVVSASGNRRVCNLTWRTFLPGKGSESHNMEGKG
jgi:hypothetical protein